MKWTRQHCQEANVAHKFQVELLNHNEVRGLLSDEHFSVDATQVPEWGARKSFGAEDGSDEPPPGGRGETRSNPTRVSRTDPEAQLCKKGPAKEARVSSSATR
jgi:hypothetical protein